MKIEINDTVFEVPFDTSKITLREFMSFHDEYGRELNQLLSDIKDQKFEDDTEKIVALYDYLEKEALAWFSFWTKTNLFEVKDEPFIQPLLQSYRSLRELIQPYAPETFPIDFVFNNEVWTIPDYKVTPTSKMLFNEVITSKETLRQLKSIKKDKYDALPYLSAIFFRKKNEAFCDAMVDDNGERMKLIYTIPLNIAFQVAFFLNSSQNSSLTHFLSLTEREVGTPSLN